jgi:acetyl-CoA C-acetyltransferase
MKKIKLNSAFMTNFGRLDGDYFSILLGAARGIFTAVEPQAVSSVYVSSFAPEALCGIIEPLKAISRALKQEFPGLTADFFGMYKTGGEALFNCLEHYRSGFALILGCEKMTHLDAGASSGILSRTVNPHDRGYGATLPALGALVSRMYRERYSIPDIAFHSVAVKNHNNALLNPKAQFQKRVTVDDVANSPLVADPLRRLHCAPVSDGAVALLLGSEGEGITVGGWGRGTDTPLFHERDRIERFRATRTAFQTALGAARIERKDVDIVEIHDAFSPFELINLEELGFYAHGTSWRALLAGELEIEGRIAVNPSGGLKARGHPIGVCGLSSMVELYEQLTGRAGARQRTGARTGVIQSAGGVSTTSYVFILNQ